MIIPKLEGFTALSAIQHSTTHTRAPSHIHRKFMALLEFWNLAKIILFVSSFWLTSLVISGTHAHFSLGSRSYGFVAIISGIHCAISHSAFHHTHTRIHRKFTQQLSVFLFAIWILEFGKNNSVWFFLIDLLSDLFTDGQTFLLGKPLLWLCRHN